MNYMKGKLLKTLMNLQSKPWVVTQGFIFLSH